MIRAVLVRWGRDLPLPGAAATGAHGDLAVPCVTDARLCMKWTLEV